MKPVEQPTPSDRRYDSRARRERALRTHTAIIDVARDLSRAMDISSTTPERSDTMSERRTDPREILRGWATLTTEVAPLRPGLTLDGTPSGAGHQRVPSAFCR